MLTDYKGLLTNLDDIELGRVLKRYWSDWFDIDNAKKELEDPKLEAIVQLMILCDSFQRKLDTIYK